MPVDPASIASYIGVDPNTFEDDDAFKAHFDGTFVKRELAHTDKEIAGKAYGKLNGTLRGNLKGVAKELGIEGDFDTLDPTEGIKLLGKTFKEDRSKLVTDLEVAKKGGASSKDIEAIQESLKAKERELEAFKTQATEFQTKYNELDATVKGREAKAKEDAFYEEAFKGIKFREDLTPFAIDGFKTAVRSSYKPDFYDGGVRVLDKEGKIVMDPTKAQTYRAPQDIVKEWAEKEKLIGTAPTAVRKTITTTAAGMGSNQPQQPASAQGGRPGRRVMPPV